MSMLPPGTPRKIGDYEIIDKIGEGGMAIVYRARDLVLKREVAIKVLKPKFGDITVFQQRFQREAQALAKLGNNQYVPSIHNYAEYREENKKEGARAYLVTEYLPRGSLAQQLQKQPILAIQNALHICIQLLEALAYVHSKGVIHRDITPGNILFREDGSLVLSDFGLATILEEKPEDNPTRLTQEQQVPGTPFYIAPERFTQRDVIPRSDLYSVGVVLYRMLAGEQYYTLLGNPPRGIREINRMVSPELELIMLKALASEPNQRHESAAAFKTDLDLIQQGLAGVTVPITPQLQEPVNDPLPVQSGPPDLPEPTQQKQGNPQQFASPTVPATPQFNDPTPEPVNGTPVQSGPPKSSEPTHSQSANGTGGLSGSLKKSRGSRIPFWYFLSTLLLVGMVIAVAYFVKGNSPPSPPTPTAVPQQQSSHIIQIAIDMPLGEGIDASDGLPILAGADFSIEQANKMNIIPNYTIVGVADDDTGPAGTADPAQGANNMTKEINNGLTAAIIGPYNSAVAVAEMPLTNQAPIAQLSPANTDPCLTKETPAEFCSGQNDLIPTLRPTDKDNYFRVVATDDAQAKIVAQFLRKKGYRSAYIIYSEGEAYSNTFADLFRQAWQNDQGTLVAPMDNEPADAPITQYVSQLQQLPTTPDLIFFAGTMPAAARVKEAMADVPQLNTTAYVGGAGLKLDSFVNAIGSAGETGGPVYTAVPVVDDAQTQQFETNYINSSPPSPYRPYTASANDCALIIIEAMKMVIDQGILPPKNSQDMQEARRFREAIIQTIAHITIHDIPATNNLFIATSFQSFNGNGDNTNNFVSIYSLAADNPNNPWILQESTQAN